MRKAFVLLSGGMDSTTCLYQAIHDYAPQTMPLAADAVIDGIHPSKCDWVEAVSVNYGQRHKKEFLYAASTCKALGIKHSVLNLGDVLCGDGIMLTDASVVVPDIAYSDIKGVSPTFVPFRNGTLLALITAYAQKWVNGEIERIAQHQFARTTVLPQDLMQLKDSATRQMKDSCGIYFGAHADDALSWAYPDCTPEFIGAMSNAIYIGTYFTCRLHTPVMWMSKADIVRLGDRLGVPFGDTWSCYRGDEKHCATCPTCRSRKDAFRIAGVNDPTEYAA